MQDDGVQGKRVAVVAAVLEVSDIADLDKDHNAEIKLDSLQRAVRAMMLLCYHG